MCVHLYHLRFSIVLYFTRTHDMELFRGGDRYERLTVGVSQRWLRNGHTSRPVIGDAGTSPKACKPWRDNISYPLLETAY